jgi:hypothetical protein
MPASFARLRRGRAVTLAWPDFQLHSKFEFKRVRIGQAAL